MFRVFFITAVLFFATLGSGVAAAQRLAIITPEPNDISIRFSGALRDSFIEAGSKVLDSGASDSAFKTIAIETPFNMTLAEAKSVGETVGSDFLILLKGQTQRRTSLEKQGYFESSAALFIVSSRSGKLIHWDIALFEAATAAEAEAGLLTSAVKLPKTIARNVESTFRNELEPQRKSVTFPEPPDESSAAAAGLRTPIPYNRIKPAYTEQAYLHGVRATIDVEVSIDEAGKIADIDITRWAGYGLDESVIDAVRSMNWRPAERNGKQLPMRILLRYNFTKIEKEDQ